MSTRPLLAVLSICLLAATARPAAAQTPPQEGGAPAVVLRLADNSLLVGHVVREEGDSIVFDAGTLGQLTLKKSNVVATLDPATVAAAFQPPQAAAASTGMSGFAPPGKVNWTRFATFGGSFTSAPYKQGTLDPAIPALTGAVLKLPGKQYTAQGQLTLVRATNLGVAFFEASLTYAFYEPFGKQADLPKVSGGYNFRFKEGDRLYGVTRFTWYKDDVRKIDYSNQGLFGLGVHTVDTKQLKLDLVPGIALIREHKGTRFDDQWLGGWGGLEQLTYNPNQFSQIDQREFFYQAFTDTGYRGLELYIGFKGMLSKMVGVTIGYSFLYDNVIAQHVQAVPANSLFPGQPAFSVLPNVKTQSYLTLGLLVRF